LPLSFWAGDGQKLINAIKPQALPVDGLRQNREHSSSRRILFDSQVKNKQLTAIKR
jgi:hypothetical protein